MSIELSSLHVNYVHTFALVVLTWVPLTNYRDVPLLAIGFENETAANAAARAALW